MKIMISRKYIPVNVANLYKKLQLFQVGKLQITAEWHNYGSRVKLNDIHTLITDLAKKHLATNGHCISVSKVKEIIAENMLQQWLDRKLPENKFKAPCETTLSRYASKIMADPQINIHRSVKNKTQTRFAAERSIRSTISYAMTVLATHYFPGEPIKNLHVMEREKMSVGANLARDLVMEQNPGKQIIHALPGVITTTDAFTCFATTGVVNKEKELYITVSPKASLNGADASSSSRSNCTTDKHGDRHKRGLRIEVHVTFNLLTQVAGLLVCIYGLSDTELSGSDDIVSHSIRGLVCGSHQSPNCVAEGLLVLVRGKGDDGGASTDDTESAESDNGDQNCSDADNLGQNNRPPLQRSTSRSAV